MWTWLIRKHKGSFGVKCFIYIFDILVYNSERWGQWIIQEPMANLTLDYATSFKHSIDLMCRLKSSLSIDFLPLFNTKFIWRNHHDYKDYI